MFPEEGGARLLENGGELGVHDFEVCLDKLDFVVRCNRIEYPMFPLWSFWVKDDPSERFTSTKQVLQYIPKLPVTLS